LFALKGYHDTKVDEIIKAADCGDTFPSNPE
jgi:hypothetical protein